MPTTKLVMLQMWGTPHMAKYTYFEGPPNPAPNMPLCRHMCLSVGENDYKSSWIRFTIYDMIDKRKHQLTSSTMLVIIRAPIPINHHHKYELAQFDLNTTQEAHISCVDSIFDMRYDSLDDTIEDCVTPCGYM